jgi:hypothetical protein
LREYTPASIPIKGRRVLGLDVEHSTGVNRVHLIDAIQQARRR